MDPSSAALFAKYPDDQLQAALHDRHAADVVVAGTVARRPDFFYGRRTHAWHEEFPISTEHGVRVEVVDNVDLAPKLPVEPGDVIVVKGRFIPTPAGGVIHDTHHCPGPGYHQGGWIQWHGTRYS